MARKKLTKKDKDVIFKYVDKKYSFNRFGFVNISLLRSSCDLSEEITDEMINDELKYILKYK